MCLHAVRWTAFCDMKLSTFTGRFAHEAHLHVGSNEVSPSNRLSANRIRKFNAEKRCLTFLQKKNYYDEENMEFSLMTFIYIKSNNIRFGFAESHEVICLWRELTKRQTVASESAVNQI